MLRRPWIEAFDLTDEDMVAQCVEISLDSINSIRTYYQTTLPDPIERRCSVHYLVQALRPLASIVMQNPNFMLWRLDQAREGFYNGVALLEEFATHLSLARSALDEIQDAVVKISQMQQDCFLTSSLDDCFQWLGSVASDRVNDAGELDGLLAMSLNPSKADNHTPQFIHTDEWLV
jgi:hypothetical protein